MKELSEIEILRDRLNDIQKIEKDNEKKIKMHERDLTDIRNFLHSQREALESIKKSTNTVSEIVKEDIHNRIWKQLPVFILLSLKSYAIIRVIEHFVMKHYF